MSVPQLDLSRIHAPLEAQFRAAIDEVLASNVFINGPKVEAFEKEAARYLGTRHALGCSSGSDALLLALMALDIGPGDEVICPSFTFFATAGAIARVGARIVFADIEPRTFTLDPGDVEAKLTPRTRAVIPVHLFGAAADMAALGALCERRGLALIEDAAQAIGATFRGTPVGGFGRIGCFSFFPAKNLGALGDAGLVTTNDDTLAAKLRAIRTHGERERYHHDWVGGNFRLDALQAVLLSVKLPHLPAWTQARVEAAERYRRLFAGLPLVAQAADLCNHRRAAGATGDLALPAPLSGHVFNQFTLRCRRRDELRAFLGERGIASAIYYPVPLHRQRCFEHLGYRQGDLVESERAAREVLSIPIFPGLTEAEQREVVEAIAAFFAQEHAKSTAPSGSP